MLLVVVARIHPRGIIINPLPPCFVKESPKSDNTLDLPKEAVPQSFPPLVTVLSLLAWASIKRQRFFVQSSFPSSFNITHSSLSPSPPLVPFIVPFFSSSLTHSPTHPLTITTTTMVHSSQNSCFPLGTRISNYEIVNVLGEGAYGRVYLAKQIDSKTLAPKLYAIKSLRQAKLDDRQRAFQRTEIGLHARLSSTANDQHIIRLERVVREPGWVHMVMEYGPEGDLFSAITERDLYVGNHQLIRHVFLQLIDAVRHCHHHNVYHRDLKPENILVFDRGRSVKLADFGLATTQAVSNEYGCGSTFYFSPGKKKKLTMYG